MAPSGLRIESEEETLQLLLTTHFLDSVVTQEMVASAAVRYAKRSDWWVVAEVVIGA